MGNFNFYIHQYFICCVLMTHPMISLAEVRVKVTVNTSRTIFVTNKRFLSLGMDSNLVRKHWLTFNFNSHRVATLAKALAPAYLRFSGTDADRLVFQPSGADRHTGNGLFPPSTFNMTTADWDKLYMFSESVGWRLVFGFNAQLRNGSRWNPDNAESLLDYSVKKGYTDNLDFELGNEPSAYTKKPKFLPVPASQLGKDFHALREILNGHKYGKYFGKSLLVGPDINILTYKYLERYLATGSDVINAVTFHHYYGPLFTVEDFMSIEKLDSYKTRLEPIKRVVGNSPNPNLSIWNGESSSTGHPPGSYISMSYVAGFMFLDKLGLSAQLGVDVVICNTFYGFWIALIDQQLMPTPRYWIALLFKRLVGQKVLQVDGNFDSRMLNFTKGGVRIYAHCVSPSAGYPDGAIVLYGMNLLHDNVTLDLDRDRHMHLFLLTSDKWGGITSNFLLLNGKVVVMEHDLKLPDLPPHDLGKRNKLNLPPKSLFFVILLDYDAKVCLQ